MNARGAGPVVIVGARGGTNVAESLYRGAQDLGIDARLCDIGVSLSANRFVNGLSWRLRDRRPPFPGRLAHALAGLLEAERPSAMISVGLAGVERPVIEAWRASGVPCLHYSTDDPWNQGLRSRWHFQALGAYDIVFTPRRRNMDDLAALPCRRVAYLPFGYDPHVLTPASGPPPVTPEVLFAGGADAERADFFNRYRAAGAPLTLVGGYWDRYPQLSEASAGHRPPDVLAQLTGVAKVNLCLVRRANRDGHVMRSFEIAALGGCIAVEDTPEHRDIFGPDGESVVYFDSPEAAAARVKALLADPPARARLAQSVRRRIVEGSARYADRLQTMLSAARALDDERGLRQ